MDWSKGPEHELYAYTETQLVVMVITIEALHGF